MDELLKYLIIFLKFFIPSLIIKFPFQTVWLNYFLDIIDGDILLNLGLNEYSYQTIDKFADFISYIFMLLVSLNWQIRKTVIALFIYRTIGQVLFFVSRNELSFFYFQNFLEPLMLIYTLLVFRNKSESKAFKSYKRHLKLIWIIILGYKLWNEWYLHFANIDLSKILFGFTGGE